MGFLFCRLVLFVITFLHLLITENSDPNIVFIVYWLIVAGLYYIKFIWHDNELNNASGINNSSYLSLFDNSSMLLSLNTALARAQAPYNVKKMAQSHGRCFFYVMLSISYNFQYMVLRSNIAFWIIGILASLVIMFIIYKLIIKRIFETLCTMLFETIKITILTFISYFLLRYPIAGGSSYIYIFININLTGGFGFNKQTVVGMGYLFLFEMFASVINVGASSIYGKLFHIISKTKQL
jgi:hypothetical protein